MSDAQNRIKELVSSKSVFLFMKGTKSFPQCGFSSTVVQILSDFDCEFETFNVLSDAEIRSGIKEFSNWPTIPQLYVNGEFVGGCDIIRDMHSSGELAQTLGTTIKEVNPPKVTITANAKAQLKAALDEAGPDQYVHLAVSNGFEHGMHIDAKGASDLEVDVGDKMILLVDRSSAPRAEGVTIDFTEGPEGAGFRMDNPNRPPSVQEITAQELKAKMDAGEIKLYDVRGADEYAKASITGAVLVNESVMTELEALDKSTPIAFHCHHGGRSKKMADAFIQKGFRKVYNMTGGIDVWSQSVDTKVPRY